MNEIRVAIIDDHAIVRQGLRAMIDREPDLQVVGEAPSARLAPGMLDRTRPAVVLLDLRLTAGSECDGLSLCATITQRYPDIRVLVLTSSADEWLILESIKQGAKGFVVKDVDLTELVRAIRAVHRGESAFDSRSAGVVVRWMHGSQRPGYGRERHHAARAGDPGPARSRAEQRRDRAAPVHLRGDGEVPRRQRHGQARRATPRRGRVRGQQARPDLTSSDLAGRAQVMPSPAISLLVYSGHLLLLSGVAAGALDVLAYGALAQNPVPGTGHSRVVTALTSV